MFQLQCLTVQPIQPVGTKRNHPEAASPAQVLPSHLHASPPALPKAKQPQADDADDKACFQLLHVRGIPGWANRYKLVYFAFPVVICAASASQPSFYSMLYANNKGKSCKAARSMKAHPM